MYLAHMSTRLAARSWECPIKRISTALWRSSRLQLHVVSRGYANGAVHGNQGDQAQKGIRLRTSGMDKAQTYLGIFLHATSLGINCAANISHTVGARVGTRATAGTSFKHVPILLVRSKLSLASELPRGFKTLSPLAGVGP
jgi:hypothetical protein